MKGGISINDGMAISSLIGCAAGNLSISRLSFEARGIGKRIKRMSRSEKSIFQASSSVISIVDAC